MWLGTQLKLSILITIINFTNIVQTKGGNSYRAVSAAMLPFVKRGEEMVGRKVI